MFVYVFDLEDKQALLDRGYELIKADDKNGVYVFNNDDQLKFSDLNINYVLNNTMTF